MMRFNTRFRCFAFALLVLLTAQAHGQYSRYSRNNPAVHSAFAEVVARARESTVLVFSKGKQVALGAVVDERGFVLTKASELNDDIECILDGGERLKAEVIGIANRDDLALLKVKAGKKKREFKALDWADDIPPVGSWLATVGVTKRPVAVGVMSVPTRAPRSQFRWNRGFLGVSVGGQDGPATIVRVSPGSPAARASIKVNDIVTKVDGESVKNSDEMIAMLKKRQAGEVVKLVLTRDKKEKKINVKLGWFGGFNPEQNTLGGPLSGRRYGFRAVFQHDTYLRPEHCGGPLLNTDGKAVGVNIARVGRVSSQAIPVKIIREILPDLVSGKLAPKSAEKKVSAKKEESPKKAEAKGKKNSKKADKKTETGKKKPGKKKSDKKPAKKESAKKKEKAKKPADKKK